MSTPPSPDPEPPRASARPRIAAPPGGRVIGAAWKIGWQRAGRFPSDPLPEGASQRIAVNITDGKVRDCFAYLEDQAQHAAYSIRDYRKTESDRIAAAYPEPERTRLLDAYH